MKRGKRGRGRKSTPKYGLNLPDLDQARSAALNSLPSQESQRGYHAPDWVKSAIDSWLVSAGVSEGRVFRCVCRAGKTWGEGVTERVVWHVVKDCAKRAAIENVAPHDLRPDDRQISWL